MTTENSATPAAPAAASPSATISLAANIGRAGSASYVKETPAQPVQPVPASGNPPSAAPTNQQPGEQAAGTTQAVQPTPAETPATRQPPGQATTAEQPPQTSQAGEQKPQETPAAPTAPAPAATPVPVDQEADFWSRAGLTAPEPETIETVRQKWQASSREAHAKVERLHAIDALLDAKGIKLVDTETGLALKATDKYMETAIGAIDDNDAKSVYAKLTAEEKELVDEDVASKIAKMAMASVKLEARPPADGNVRQQLTADVVNQCFGELIAERLPDGQPRFAELGHESIQTAMRKLYDHQSMADFRVFANESPANMKIALNLLHGAAFRIIAPQLAQERDKREQEQLKQQNNQRTPSTLPSTSGGQTQSQAGTAKVNMSTRIGMAGRSTPW